MNNFSALDSRNRRNLLAHSINAFSPPFHKNYSIDTTTDMKTLFGDSLFINTIHLIPEPLKMNLADSIVTINEKKLKTNMAAETKVNNNFNMKNPQNTKSDYYPSLAGITNFFSGVFNVMGAMFQKRANSPVQYYDCFEQGFEDQHQMTPSSPAWQGAKHEDQNINGRAQTDEFANETYSEFSTDMSNNFKSIATHCENKLNQVRLLLNNPQVQKTARIRRPKRAFHEAGSVEELFEDAFNPEDFISLANETFYEYCSPINYHHEELQSIDAPKIKTNTMPVKESMEIVKSITSNKSGELINASEDKIDSLDTDTKKQIVSSCQEKVSKLKALLQSRRAHKTNLNESESQSENTPTVSVDPQVTSPISIPNQSEVHNHTDVIFAQEINLPVTLESPCVLNPSSYFDEVTGRFYSSSTTDSEDSFQIVFSDSPQNRRKRLPSDCESEDSFIVFEESPDSCYISNDVFGDDPNDATNILDSEESDSDCGSDLDSGLNTIALSHSLTRTFGDLTDGSLYEDSKSEDVVDCAFKGGVEVPRELIDTEKVERLKTQDHNRTNRGILLDDTRKSERKKLPDKKVHFSALPPKVHVMRVWAFAARQARAGHWERHALDRERFKRRIADVEVAVSWVLKPQHRSRVMFQRFMPWWNAQKRKELAEQKQKETEERLKREKEEAEKLAMEEEKERLREKHASNKNGSNEKLVVNQLGIVEDKEKLGEVLENVNEDKEVRVEKVGNEIVNDINCKIYRLINAGSVANSDDTVVDSTQTMGTYLGETCICAEIGEISANEIVTSDTGVEKLQWR